MNRSMYVCARCGISVYMWGAGDGHTWKHAVGGDRGPKSCGQPPRPIPRQLYEEARALKEALK